MPRQVHRPQLSTGVMAVILTLIIIFAAFFLVAVPIAFVVFYGRKDVAETVHHRDPLQRWTDRTPLPVLGASVVLALGSLYLLLIGLTNPVFPFFGKYLTGVAGSACFLVMAALDTYLAVALFRLQSSGWWIAAITIPVRLLSMILTYARADMMQAYSKMGMSDAQLKMLSSNSNVSRPRSVVVGPHFDGAAFRLSALAEAIFQNAGAHTCSSPSGAGRLKFPIREIMASVRDSRSV